MSILDYFLFLAVLSIWGILVVNVVLTIAGYVNYLQKVRRPEPQLPVKVPFVSIMVPAHNEGIVIVKTLQSLLNFDYPKDRYEIIIINTRGAS
ncbi:glycosyltransferase, partial [Lactiplantibacillus plantarum]|uniref:glycosyltransferase n=1 Tax=Lactiplantibacillus plantarum TaxID=1590 RepID=UPI001F31CBED